MLHRTPGRNWSRPDRTCARKGRKSCALWKKTTNAASCWPAGRTILIRRLTMVSRSWSIPMILPCWLRIPYLIWQSRSARWSFPTSGCIIPDCMPPQASWRQGTTWIWSSLIPSAAAWMPSPRIRWTISCPVLIRSIHALRSMRLTIWALQGSGSVPCCLPSKSESRNISSGQSIPAPLPRFLLPKRCGGNIPFSVPRCLRSTLRFCRPDSKPADIISKYLAMTTVTP